MASGPLSRWNSTNPGTRSRYESPAQPYFLERSFGPSLHTKTIHGDKHLFSPDCKGQIVVSYALYVAAFARGVRTRCAARTKCLMSHCLFLTRYARDLVKKVGRFLRRPTSGPPPQSSARVGDELLSIHLSRCRRLRRQLQYCCRLTFAQVRQQHGPPIRKFERVVIGQRACLC